MKALPINLIDIASLKISLTTCLSVIQYVLEKTQYKNKECLGYFINFRNHKKCRNKNIFSRFIHQVGIKCY